MSKLNNTDCYYIEMDSLGIYVFSSVIMSITFKFIFKILCKINNIVLKMHNARNF